MDDDSRDEAEAWAAARQASTRSTPDGWNPDGNCWPISHGGEQGFGCCCCAEPNEWSEACSKCGHVRCGADGRRDVPAGQENTLAASLVRNAGPELAATALAGVAGAAAELDAQAEGAAPPLKRAPVSYQAALLAAGVCNGAKAAAEMHAAEYKCATCGARFPLERLRHEYRPWVEGMLAALALLRIDVVCCALPGEGS